MAELFKATGLKQTAKSEAEIGNMIHGCDYFVLWENTFYLKTLFLKNFLIRMHPNEFELKEGIFVPGHWLLPFHPPWAFMGDIAFQYNGSPVKTRTRKLKIETIMPYFALMDFQKVPILNIEDMLDENADLEIEVCDLKSFYKKNNFQPGDSIIIEPLDLKEGLFAIRYEAHDSYEGRIFEINRIDKKFVDTLEKVLQMELVFPNAEKQLLYTYFLLSREAGAATRTIAGSALLALLKAREEIKASSLADGRILFHFVHQNIEDLKVNPDFNDFTNMALEELDEEPDFDTIDGILQYLGNNNDIVVVRALLLDQIAAQKKFSYKDVEDYLFDGAPKPFMPPELRGPFKELVHDEFHEIKEAFDPASAFLPITTARKKVLEAMLLISGFLRSLDAQGVQPEQLPQDDMLNLMELDRNLAEFLSVIETAQLEGENNSAEIRRVLKMIDVALAQLPKVFDLIREQINA
jgi:hypothetical protein